MALSEDEEFELLSLQRQRAMAGGYKPGPQLDSKGRYIVEPNAQQRFAGISKNRYKDENLAGNVGRGILSFGEDMGREASLAATDYGLPPSVANALGFAADAGTAFIPVGTGTRAAVEIGKPVMQQGAKFFMQSALKPTSKSLANGEAAQAIDTMLREGVSATPSGAAKLRTKINELKAEVGKIISQSPAEVNRGYAYRELATTLDKVGEKGAGYKADQDAVRKAWEEFKNHPLLDKFAEESDMIPIQMADKVKRATQQAVDYSRVTPSVGEEASQKAIAAGLRKGMEAAEPRIIEGNKKLSEYLNALNQIEPRAAAIANQQLGGLVPLAHTPEAAMLMLADRNPWMKSYIARALYGGSEAIPAAAGGAVAGTGVAATNKRGQ